MDVNSIRRREQQASNALRTAETTLTTTVCPRTLSRDHANPSLAYTRPTKLEIVLTGTE